MTRSPLLIALSALFLLSACPKKEAAPAPAAEAPTEVEAELPAEVQPDTWIAARVSGLRRQPSTDKKVSEGEKQVNNWVTSLYRGEKIKVTDSKPEWQQIETLDGQTGWVPTADTVGGVDFQAVTLAEEAKRFDRPSLVAVSKRDPLPAGSFLVIVDRNADFAEVNYLGSYTTWISASALVDREDAVEVARMIERVRWLKERKDGEGIEDILEVATEHMGEEPLLAVLREEVSPGAGGEGGLVFSLSLHGSTPTLAWAPDSKRLAFNSAFQAFDDAAETGPAKSSAGVYVWEVGEKAAARVSREPGYHPSFTDATTLAWSNSGYDWGQDGIFTADLKAKGAAPKRLLEVEWVSRVAPAKDRDLLYHAGSGWRAINPKTGTMSAAFPQCESADEHDFDPACEQGAWDLPHHLVADQCLKEVTNLSLRVLDGKVVELTETADDSEKSRRFDEKPLYIFKHDYKEGAAGPVGPCLSPDGTKVAWVAAGPAQSSYEVVVFSARP